MSIVLHTYIPTRGRIDKQKTVDSFFLREVGTRYNLTFVVPAFEERAFKQAHPWAKTMTVPANWRIGRISQHILESPGRFKLLIDDDFALLRRRDPHHPSQKGSIATKQDAIDCFERMKYWLGEGFIHGGVSLRGTNKFYGGMTHLCKTRVSGFMFLDSKIVLEEGVRFDAVQERQDFHITLSLLELGYPNVCDYEFMVGQPADGTNAEGGCSRYRSPDFLREQAERLVALHPETTEVIYKQRKSSNLQKVAAEEGVPDVKVSWGRTYRRYSDRKRLKVYDRPIKVDIKITRRGGVKQ